jgi:hypothetical protein
MRLLFIGSLGILTVVFVALVLIAAPVKLRAAGAVTQPAPQLGPPTLQSLQDQLSVLNLSVGKLRDQVDALKTQLDASNKQLDALNKQVGLLKQSSVDSMLRTAFCNHNHIVEYNNRDQGTFGLIDNTTGQRPAICTS